MAELTSKFVRANGLNFHVVQAGREDGTPVLLLHGFPEFWYGWRRQIPALAEAGFRVWAPDQRGYNLSDKPQGLDPYRLDHLAADAAALIQQMGGRAHVVGHDWGAIVAWYLAMVSPEYIDKLVILNVPHPVPFERALRTNPRQIVRSLYGAFFQLPRLPELAIMGGGCKGGKAAMVGSSAPGTFSEIELAEYCRAWRQPGAMTAMLNWYRAFVQRRPPIPDDVRVHVPTLILWGKRDVALIRELARESAAMCDDARLVTMDEVSHWVQHEAAERVNGLMVEFLTEPPRRQARQE